MSTCLRKRFVFLSMSEACKDYNLIRASTAAKALSGHGIPVLGKTGIVHSAVTSVDLLTIHNLRKLVDAAAFWLVGQMVWLVLGLIVLLQSPFQPSQELSLVLC
jgi:hypothetical protein